MKKSITLFILFLSLSLINAQEKRTILVGETLKDSIKASDVHIINLNTNIGTISNTEGIFEIPVKLGDSIHISHLNFEEQVIIISENIFSENRLSVFLKEKTYALEAFTLEKKRNMFYEDPEIKKYFGPKITAKTLNLPYANSVKEEDNSILKFKSGAVVSLDNLFNSLNGSAKRKKIIQELTLEDAELSKIRKYFTDDFFITDLKIKKEYINQFLNFCIDKQIISAFKHQNKIDFIQTLITISKEFPNRIPNENLYLTKQ